LPLAAATNPHIQQAWEGFMTNESLFSGLRVLDIASFIAGPAVRRQYQRLTIGHRHYLA
jgi:hypothetical protein